MDIISTTPGYRTFIEQIRDHTAQHALHQRSAVWLPVVFHVVTKAGQHISHAQIIHQLDVLNQDFANKGENIHKLRDEFRDISADTEIRFCLATTDPDGNPSPGITYTTTTTDQIALQRDDHGRYIVHYDQLGGKTGWDPSRYINVWIAEYGNGFLAYASLPGTAPFPEEIGLIIDPFYFGSTGTALQTGYFNKGHTLTHEMGHFLGLLHIWGDDEDSCSDSDEVDDTPVAQGPWFDCPSGEQISCGVSNMYQNFMDLTDDRCLAAFTQGQAERMKAVIGLYYPEMPQSSCLPVVSDLDSWWDDLSWSFDIDAGKYVLYTPAGLSGKWQIELFTVDGKRLLSENFDGRQSYLLNLRQAAPGVYIIRVTDGEHSATRKIALIE
jgi:hypothetical protein